MGDARVTLITGGAAGIGRAAAGRFAEAGDHVGSADVLGNAAREAVESISRSGGQASYYQLDVADDGQVSNVVQAIEENEGPIDALVTCAGILQNPGGIEDMPLEEHDRMWRINYRGVYMTCREVGPRMTARGRGAIVNMHSTTSTRPYPLVAYGTGKTSLKMLTEVLAAEFGPSGVRVNGVAPGVTMTENMKRRVAAGERDPEKIIAWNAIPEIVVPEDVAESIFFLCSEEARAISGVTLPIDYGWQVAVNYNAYPR